MSRHGPRRQGKVPDGHRLISWCNDCNKKTFGSKKAAKTVRRATGRGLDTYFCPAGRGWHNGTLPDAVKQGKLPRSVVAEANRQQIESRRALERDR